MNDLKFKNKILLSLCSLNSFATGLNLKKKKKNTPKDRKRLRMEKGTRAGGGKGGKMLHLAWKNRRKTCSWRDGGDAKGNSAHSREDPSLVKCGNIGSRLLSPVHARNPIVNPILRNSIETAARSSSIEVAWLSIKKREREREEQPLEGKMERSDRLFIRRVMMMIYFLRLCSRNGKN